MCYNALVRFVVVQLGCMSTSALDLLGNETRNMHSLALLAYVRPFATRAKYHIQRVKGKPSEKKTIKRETTVEWVTVFPHTHTYSRNTPYICEYTISYPREKIVFCTQ